MNGFIGLLLLLGFGFVTGLRHGVDVDHIAAITDMTSSQPDRRRGIWYAILYGIGHGLVVIVLGVILIAVGRILPESVDIIFGKIVGITLVFLGLYVLYSLYRYGRNFKMKSRWMLIFSAIKFGYHKFLHNFKLSHQHPKLRTEKYQSKTAFGIGLIHGVGAETPTQIAALATLIGIGEGLRGILFLLLFVLGILISNLVLAYLSSAGYLKAKQQSKVYPAVGFLTALFSLIVGIEFLRA